MQGLFIAGAAIYSIGVAIQWIAWCLPGTPAQKPLTYVLSAFTQTFILFLLVYGAVHA